MNLERPRSRPQRYAAIVLLVLLTSLLAIGPVVVAADTCAAGQICVVTIDNTTYTVIGPCDTSTSIAGCLIIGTGPSDGGGGGSLIICGLYGCGPDVITQRFLGATPLEQEARQEIAALRGVPDDNLNLYWSRGEIRAYMYLRLLALAKADSATLSTEQQQTVTEYTDLINEERVTLAQAAVDLYNTWASNPCGFHVPVGDPNAYLDEPDVANACSLPPNSPACLLGACTPAPPSAEQFTAWAEGGTLEAQFNAWGIALQQQGNLSLTADQAEAAAAFEYDTTLGGVAEGIGYLTTKHAAVADIPEATENQAESDLQERWLEALHDFAGEQFRDVLKTSIVAVFQAFDTGVAEGFASELEGGLAIALEEDAAGVIAEGWETVIGPIIAAAATIAFETWQQIINAEVPQKLQAALDDANTAHNLAYYAGDADGRALILHALVNSTMPDFVATRLASADGSAPASGPASDGDPVFIDTSNEGVTQTEDAFPSYDWERNAVSTSVRNGWFVQQRGSGTFRYTPSVSYLSGGGTVTCEAQTCSSTVGVIERWRAWLDGSQFLAQRTSVEAGNGMVTDAVNSCGANSILLPSGNMNLGYMCVYPTGNSIFEFPIQSGDVVEMAGQVRTVAYVSTDASGDVMSFATETPFSTDPATGAVPTNVPVSVLTNPNGDCTKSSALGTRVSGHDCVISPTIRTLQGATVTLHARPILTITASSATVAFGDPVPPIMPSYDGFVSGDTAASLTTPPTCATTYTVGDGGGTYPTVCSGAVDPNYVIRYVAGAVTVPFAPMTITAPTLSLHYGDPVPALSPTYWGEGAGNLLAPPTCTTTYQPGDPPGTYPTVCSGASPQVGASTCSGAECTYGDPLFTIFYVGGDITVDPAPLTITASAAAVTYGDSAPTITPGYDGFVLAETSASLDMLATCATTYVQGADAGVYSSSCSGAASVDYAISYVDGTVSVAKAQLSAVASDATAVLGGSIPPLTGTLTGVVTGDDITADYATTATSSSPIGNYPINPSLVDPDDRSSNYDVTLTPGTLTIEYAPLGTDCLGAPSHTVLSPIAADGSSVFKQRRVVAVKFRVCDATGASIGTPGLVSSFKLVQITTSAGTQLVDQDPQPVSNNGAFRFDPINQQWVFQLATSSLAAGATYRYVIGLNDGSTIEFQFTLR